MPTLRYVLILGLLAGLAACGDVDVSRAPAATGTATDAPADAVLRVGKTTFRASAVQTSMLDAAVADQYGIARDTGTILLLVAVRKGDDASAVAVPATVTASVTNARGSRIPVAMRELRSGDPAAGDGLIDHVGMIDIRLPDTLRFDIQVQTERGDVQTLQLSRDFYPQ